MTRILTIDELLAICNEIKTLSKAGVPLEKGLLVAANDLPKRLKGAAGALGNEGARGVPVESIIHEDVGLPPIFKAVIKAGKRSGNLSLAVEGLYDSGKRAINIRRKIITALFYPILVLVLLLVVSNDLFRRLPAMLVDTLSEQQLQPSPGILWALEATRFVSDWIWLPIVAFLIWFAIWWFQSKSAMVAQSTWFASITRWVPWVGRMLRLGRLAVFVDLLAMFVRNDVPLHEGLVLAASVTGDPEIKQDAELISKRIQRGQPMSVDGEKLRAIPKLLDWQLDLNLPADELASTLASEAENYQHEAEHLAEWCNIQLPILFTALIAGTATFAYAFCVIYPLSQLLEQFALPL